jgi:hypothetical protein
LLFVQAAAAQRRRKSSSGWKWLLVLAAAAAVAVAVHYRPVWEEPALLRLQQLQAQTRAGARAVEEYVRGPLRFRALQWKGVAEDMAWVQR